MTALTTPCADLAVFAVVLRHTNGDEHHLCYYATRAAADAHVAALATPGRFPTRTLLRLASPPAYVRRCVVRPDYAP
jgi:hypothetical protein